MMNKVQNSLVAALVLILLITGPAIAQTEPEELLESGVYMEEVEGNLEGAIAIFERIIDEFPGNRSVAARALLHLGSSYEKLGNQRAEQAYQRLISEFGDQEAMVSEARMRLQKIRFRELAEGIESKGAGPSYRIALDEDAPGDRPMWFRQFDFSPSGDQIVYQTWDGLFVSDASGTLRRQLVAEGDHPQGWSVIYSRNGQARWSPDGKQIAYFAGKKRPPGKDPNDMIWTIFVIDIEGGDPRQLGEFLDPKPYGGLCWTPDGTKLTYFADEGAITLDLEGKTVGRVDVGRNHHTATLNGYSPDGRWLGLTLKADVESENNYDTDIYLVPSGGGEAVQLTFISGYDGMPAWGNDGRSIYFVSGRNNEGRNTNLWKLQINEKTGEPIGDPEQVTFFSDALIVHPRLVGDGSNLAFLLAKTKHSIHVAPDGQPDNYNTVARGLYPQLSPDGKTVYYVGEGPENQGIFSVSAEGGKPQSIAPFVPLVSAKDISPDGKTLTYFKSLNGENGLFAHPTDGGEPILLAKTGCDECCAMPRFSPDGKLIAYTYVDGLFVISPTGGEPKLLATIRRWEAWTIRWSPDGKYIAGLGYKEGEQNNAVYVVPVEGGEPRLISDFDEYKEGLEWHPDGLRLTYHESKTKSDTRITYLDGRPPELFLDKNDVWDYVGIWSPEGDRYFLSGFRGAKTECVDIYHVNTEEYTLFSDDAASLPSWSGDQKTMVWTVERKISQLWLMKDFR
jgi:Tol biopolymer transport system component